MKWLLLILLSLFVLLQYRLWVSEGSLADVVRLEREVDKQKAANDRLQERNRVLVIEVEELKTGLDSVEERARQDMGMVKEGETFYMLIEPQNQEQ